MAYLLHSDVDLPDLFCGLVDAERVGHMLGSYVTHGSMDHADQFDAEFDFAADRLPRHLATCPDTVFRVLTLGPDQVRTLEEGRAVELEPRRFGSWSTTEDAALSFLRLRSFLAGPDDVLVVIRRSIDPASCVLNTEDVYRHLGWNCGSVHEWTMYVEWEKEVILRQNASLCRVEPADIVHSFSPSDPEAIAPRSGEKVWHDPSSDFVEIDHVVRSGRYINPEWRVVLVTGRTVDIRWDRRNDCWDVQPIPSPGLRP